MADKKLSSVSAVSDMNFVYAETASGETVKISKADLASVVAGLIGLSSVKHVRKDTNMSPSVGIDIDINKYTGVIVSIYDTYYKYTNCFYASPFSFNRLDSDSHAFINATLEGGVLKLRGSSGNYYCKLGAWLF